MNSEGRSIRRIVILGGGSAGWLTAGVLASRHRIDRGSPIRITLVESPDVATVGVGEGTWPSMRDTLRRIGLSETDLFRECDAAFKQGSEFRGWWSGAPEDHYFHPFMAPTGFGEVDLTGEWQARTDGRSFAALASPQPWLCEAGRGPKQAGTPEYAAVANYAYHLDAGKFGDWLRRHVTQQLGVTLARDHVTAVRSADNGDIEALELREQGRLPGDLFIDCSGFRSLLLGEHFGIPFQGCGDVLFCDRALAAQLPYPSPDQALVPHTVSTAQPAGWTWDIGLPARRGLGYVYSSQHSSEADADAVLREHAASLGADPESLEPRQLVIQPGRRQVFWHRNAVAVGLSAGFIEPLEASALALVELSAAMIADNLPPDRDLMDVQARRFNQRFEYRWERIIDFLKLHYVLSAREDTAFWRDNRNAESVPDSLKERLALWHHQAPSRYDFPEIDEIFPAASHQYVLYGMGRVPSTNALGAVNRQSRHAVEESASQRKRLMRGLPPARALIESIIERGMPTI